MNKPTSFNIFISAIFLALGSLLSYAVQITPNTVYRLKNHNGRYMSITDKYAITDVDNANDSRQQWYITAKDDGTGYYLRNVPSSGYLKSPLQRSTQWTVSLVASPNDNDMLISFADNGDEVYFRAVTKTTDDSYMCARNNAYDEVTCWIANSSSPNSYWTLEPVSLTATQLQQIQSKFANIDKALSDKDAIDKHLDNLFTDKSRTKLVSGFDPNNNADYTALPQPLKDLVDKVNKNDWSETYDYSSTYAGTTGDWDDTHARKYRVQWYEPYSEGGAVAVMAGSQSHTNMNNPTGILGDSGDLMYIMVDGEIKEGATLYVQEVVGLDMFNTPTAGTELKPGLNIVPVINDNAHLFIYYTVTTTKMDGNNRVPDPAHILSNYEPIKIHIEGGRLNGFYNSQGDRGVDTSDDFYYAPDTKDDIKYTLARATHPMFDLMGKYQIQHIHLADTKYESSDPLDATNALGVRSVYLGTEKNGYVYDPKTSMDALDKIIYVQRMIMGTLGKAEIEVDDYYEDIVNDNYFIDCGGTKYTADPGFHFGDYFNNRHMSISTVRAANALSMNATHWRTLMNTNQIEGVLTITPLGNDDFFVWNSSHEYGHLNQQLILIAGTTESSNNLFSNACVYMFDKKMSRTNYTSDMLNLYLNNKTYLESGDGITRILYQLWCYYHVEGHNKKFYPRFFELLRHNPIKYNAGTGGKHDEKYDMLNIYKMACLAANEDLTDLFAAYGFFVPLNDYLIRDYYTYTAVLTQEEIDVAKKEIAELNLTKNDAILFIDDKVRSIRNGNGGYNAANAGQYGTISDFSLTSPAKPSGNSTYSIDGVTIKVTVNGNPGVGYLVLDNDGSLLAFANNDTFNLNAGIVSKLVGGEASIYFVGGDNSKVEVTNILSSGSIDDLKKMLQSTFEYYQKQLNNYADRNGNRVGYIEGSYIDGLIADMKTKVDELSSSQNPNNASFTELIQEMLETEITISEDKFHRIQIEPGAAYKLVMYGSTYGLTANSTIRAISGTDQAQFEHYWLIENAENRGEYTLQNWNYNTYIYTDGVAQNSNMPMSETKKDGFTLVPVEGLIGVFNISTPENTEIGITGSHSPEGNVYLTNISIGDLARWTVTRVADAEYVVLQNKLGDLMERGQEILLSLDYVTNMDLYFALYMQMYEAEDYYHSTSVDKETLSQAVEELENNIVYAEAIVNNADLIIFNGVASSNDSVDETTDTEIIRHAFVPGVEIKFENIITLDQSIDAENINVEIIPVSGRLWKNTTAQSDELEDEYLQSFDPSETDDNFLYWFNLTDVEKLDGFYTSASARLEATETKHTYNLIIDAPCSGLYQIKLSSASSDKAIFDTANKIPSFNVEIYPNLMEDYGLKGINIDGYTFNNDDTDHNKTIILSYEYVQNEDLTDCKIYLPGTYFADAITASWAQADNEPEVESISIRKLASSNASSSYFTTIDLSPLKTSSTGGIINVSVSKNGATANFAFNVKTGSKDVVTSVEDIVIDNFYEYIYYNLQGVRIKNPEKGIYIRVKNGKSEKVAI